MFNGLVGIVFNFPATIASISLSSPGADLIHQFDDRYVAAQRLGSQYHFSATTSPRRLTMMYLELPPTEVPLACDHRLDSLGVVHRDLPIYHARQLQLAHLRAGTAQKLFDLGESHPGRMRS